MVAADSKAKLLQDAERFVLHGKVQQAIGEYLKIVKFDPNDVLILNTIGDLYLRLGNSSEANKYFSQVAQNYVQNNFFLKAIAVYKKILSADPNDLEINSTMASLYAKQGLSIDARNQYQRVATLLEKEGKSRESMEAYEKIVELDPGNAAIQRKLAELYSAQGAQEQAHSHWTGAARAQAKSGDFAGAADSFERAMQMNPLDVEAMRGFLDCSLELNNPGPALEQLKKSVESAPQNLDLREMLGQAYLANKDPESAARAFQIVFSMDEARYGNLFSVADALLGQHQYDQAATILGNIVPALISRRETDRAVRLFEKVLDLCPGHLPATVQLASIYSATGDQARQLEMLDKVADSHVERKSPIEAIECLEKILELNPESEKHLALHRKLSLEAYPDIPYTAPVRAAQPVEVSGFAASVDVRDAAAPEPSGSNSPQMVEVDLLINYGLREKALSLLLGAEARDPYDKEVRLRLLSIYKAEKKYTEAAEQALLLAALYRRLKNEEAAQTYIAESKQLVPEMAEYEKDLDSFARRSGIESEAAAAAAGTAVHDEEPEVDLSSDVLDIFFSGDQESVDAEDRDGQETQDVIAEAFPQSIPSQASSKPVEEQLQEVDFYLRLGFREEAQAKLNEIARTNPNHPELASRYQKLEGIEQPAAQKPAAFKMTERPLFGDSGGSASSEGMELFRELQLDDTLDGLDESAPDEAAVKQGAAAPQPAVPKEEFHANEMFADLMEEVGALSNQEIAKESFEDHFSLGTAYRDMELNEEAIREFQLAMKIADLKKDTGRVIQCCGMLSTCYLNKRMPSSALRWCQTGLGMTDISSHEAMALRYDMGIAHSMSGSKDRALECFDEIFGRDPSYRDVAQKIDELRAKGGFERHAP